MFTYVSGMFSLGELFHALLFVVICVLLMFHFSNQCWSLHCRFHRFLYVSGMFCLGELFHAFLFVNLSRRIVHYRFRRFVYISWIFGFDEFFCTSTCVSRRTSSACGRTACTNTGSCCRASSTGAEVVDGGKVNKKVVGWEGSMT